MRRLPLLAAAVAALALPASAHAAHNQYTIFEAPRELASDDATLRDKTFSEIEQLGVDHIRVLLYWNSVAPSPNARQAPAFDETNPDAGYDWSRYDHIVSDAAARGIKVMLTVTGPVPTWATANHKGHTYKPSAARFERFVTAVGRRYGANVSTWSVWNEPNHPDFLTPQFAHHRAYSPLRYRALYRAALKGLSASGNGHDSVLAGETAPRGTPRVVAPLAFVRGFFHNANGLKVTAWAHHPYTTKVGPWFVPPGRDDVTIGVLSRLTRQLDRVRRHIPVYLTEFGIQSKPDPYVGVSQVKQAEYRSIAERIAYDNPRVKAFSQYMMRDDAPRAGSAYARYSGFESGLRTATGKAKLAYDGFRLPLVARRHGGSVTLWGLARPAHGATQVKLQWSSGHRWHTLALVTTDKRGYFTRHARYRHGRSYRVLWSTYTGPRTHVY